MEGDEPGWPVQCGVCLAVRGGAGLRAGCLGHGESSTDAGLPAASAVLLPSGRFSRLRAKSTGSAREAWSFGDQIEWGIAFLIGVARVAPFGGFATYGVFGLFFE